MGRAPNKPQKAPEDDTDFYHRRYPTRLLAYILIILLLSCLDAFFTLHLLDIGAAETNPVMAFFLCFGPTVFMIVKYGITAVCVLVILFGTIRMGEKKKQLADRLFCLLVVAYGIVIIWELYLMFFGLS